MIELGGLRLLSAWSFGCDRLHRRPIEDSAAAVDGLELRNLNFLEHLNCFEFLPKQANFILVGVEFLHEPTVLILQLREVVLQLPQLSLVLAAQPSTNGLTGLPVKFEFGSGIPKHLLVALVSHFQLGLQLLNLFVLFVEALLEADCLVELLLLRLLQPAFVYCSQLFELPPQLANGLLLVLQKLLDLPRRLYILSSGTLEARKLSLRLLQQGLVAFFQLRSECIVRVHLLLLPPNKLFHRGLFLGLPWLRRNAVALRHRVDVTARLHPLEIFFAARSRPMSLPCDVLVAVACAANIVLILPALAVAVS